MDKRPVVLCYPNLVHMIMKYPLVPIFLPQTFCKQALLLLQRFLLMYGYHLELSIITITVLMKKKSLFIIYK